MSVIQLACGCLAPTDEGYPRSGVLCDEASKLWATYARASVRSDVAPASEAWKRLNEHWDQP